jgi:hypothetical protein
MVEDHNVYPEEICISMHHHSLIISWAHITKLKTTEKKVKAKNKDFFSW